MPSWELIDAQTKRSLQSVKEDLGKMDALRGQVGNPDVAAQLDTLQRRIEDRLKKIPAADFKDYQLEGGARQWKVTFTYYYGNTKHKCTLTGTALSCNPA